MYTTDEPYIEAIIKDTKSKYEPEIVKNNKLFAAISKTYNLQAFQQAIEQQKKLTTEIILNVISFFPLLENCDFIMFNGSYARSTNILYSDIDLNIMYQKQHKDVIFPIELAINYILSKIFGFRGCDRIHSIMVYTELIADQQPQLKNSGIIYKENIIPYYCRENYEKLLFETFNTTRDYKKLLKYFELNDNIFNEWEYNFELIKDYGQYDKFVSDIDSRKNQKHDYINLLNKEILELKNKISEFKYLESRKTHIFIKDIKKNIKSIPTEILYKALAIICVNKNIKCINVKKLVDANIIDSQFSESIYVYLWSLMRIQLIICEKFNIDLSSHSSEYIESDALFQIYYQEYKQNLLDVINSSIEKLFSNIIRCLEDDICEKK